MASVEPSTPNNWQNNLTKTLEKSRVPLAIVGALALIAVIGSFIWSDRKSDREEVASRELTAARSKLEADLMAWTEKQAAKQPKSKTPDKNMRPDMPTDEYAAIPVDQEFATSVGEMKKMTEKYEGTRSAFYASLELGKLYYDHQQFESAAQWFQKAAEDSPSKLEGALAWASTGYARENIKDWKGALQAFDEALKVKSAAVRGEVLLAKARVQTAQGEKEHARATYEMIKKELADTPHARTAETHLKSL